MPLWSEGDDSPVDGTVFSENSQTNVVMWHYIVTFVWSVRASLYSFISRYCIQRISKKHYHYTNHNSKLSCGSAFVSRNFILQCEAPKIAKLVYKFNNYGLWYLYITIVTGAYKPTYNWGAPHSSEAINHPYHGRFWSHCFTCEVVPSETCWEKHRTTRSIWIYWTRWFSSWIYPLKMVIFNI